MPYADNLLLLNHSSTGQIFQSESVLRLLISSVIRRSLRKLLSRIHRWSASRFFHENPGKQLPLLPFSCWVNKDRFYQILLMSRCVSALRSCANLVRCQARLGSLKPSTELANTFRLNVSSNLFWADWNRFIEISPGCSCSQNIKKD